MRATSDAPSGTRMGAASATAADWPGNHAASSFGAAAPLFMSSVALRTIAGFTLDRAQGVAAERALKLVAGFGGLLGVLAGLLVATEQHRGPRVLGVEPWVVERIVIVEQL